MAFLDNIFGGDSESKEKAGSFLNFIAGKEEGRGPMYHLLTGFTNLIASLTGALTPQTEEQKQADFEDIVEGKMAGTIAKSAIKAAYNVIGEEADLSSEQVDAMNAAWEEGVKNAEALLPEYTKDGTYSVAEQAEFKNKVEQHFNSELNNVRKLG